MNWKNRLTNYNFWISIVSAVLLILQAFEFQFDIMYINEIATAVLGLLVVIGIINDPTKTTTKKTEKADQINKSEPEKMKNNVETKVKEMPIEEQIILESSTIITDERVEEQTFPIDEENETVDDIDENDIKNFVAEDVEIENSEIKKMFENLLKLLKNDEKIDKNLENLENFSKKEEILNEKKELQTSVSLKVQETQQTISTETNVKEIIEEIPTEKVEEVIQNIDLSNNENIEDLKIQPEEIKIDIQPVEETEVQASSFNIVN